MTTNRICAAILVGSVVAPVAGCSSDAAPPTTFLGVGGGTSGTAGRAGSGGTSAAVEGQPSQAGVAGQAGGAGMDPTGARTPCGTSQDCDNGKPCDGQEACVAGVCAAGEARRCDANLECSDSQDGACVFTDQSPWIVYQADDDTPGVIEVYAVKRGLLGKMTPIKLNDPLEAGWQAAWGGAWSPDHQMYTFSVRQQSPYLSFTEAVHFGHGLPDKAIRLTGENIEWAPSGRSFVMSEESGVSIYDYAIDGTFKNVFSATAPDNRSGYGHWTSRNELVFASISKLTKQGSLERASYDGSNWSRSTLVQGIDDLWRFEVSPTGAELVYEAQPSGSTYEPLYVIETEPGSQPAVLAAGGNHSFTWSPDGSQFLLLDDSEGYTGAYLGTGSAYWQTPTQIAPNELIASAAFTPDSKQIMLWEPSLDWAHDIELLDPAKSPEYSYDMIARNGLRDNGPFFSSDHDLGVVPLRDDEEADVRLSLFSLSGRHSTDRFDAIPASSEYRDVEISAHNEFVAYTKGVYPDYDGAYVDLRYDTAGDPKPVRLPGEGALFNFNFDPSGTAIYYIREQENGARDCYYLDLSRQVAAAPVKVNRDGRTDYCIAQPLTP